MLHRHHSDREKHSINLVLSYAPIGLIRATKALIGTDSICVDTGCIALQDDCEVDIVLSINRGTHSETHRIRAEVCGSDENGVKLRFRDCARATMEALLPYITRH